jgi:hypothetical protein
MTDISAASVDCPCLQSAQGYLNYLDIRSVGVDPTQHRYGEVTVKQCKHCGRLWLHYFVEYEAFSESGRWFMGLITPEQAEAMTPEKAIDYLDTLDWHLQGGSYFRTASRRSTGKAGPLTT